MTFSHLIHFEFDENDKILCISNNSPWNLLISVKPTPPRRKIWTAFVIQSKTFKVWPETPLDPQYLMFHFDMPKVEEE